MKVLYISGYTENVLEVQGKLGSVTAFLQKPFAPSVLVHRVREDDCWTYAHNRAA